jgi:hypothetical protein
VKVVIIQSFRTHDVPDWIARCLASVRAWAQQRGFDYWLTDDSLFALCGDDYLAAVGDNMRSITNLCRLEIIGRATAGGYDYAVWLDADVLVFDPARFELPATPRIAFARETWLWTDARGWQVHNTLNNAAIICPAADPDLGFIIEATRHRARHHKVTTSHQVGVELIRGLHRFMDFDLVHNVGMFSPWVLTAIARGDREAMAMQALRHGAPVHAANISASPHVEPNIPEAEARAAMDLLQATRGGVINDHLESAHVRPA